MTPDDKPAATGRNPWTIWLLWLAFLGVLTFNLSRHEMWRDELQAFGLARDADSLGQLWAHVRYEGHPGLYHLLLWIASRFTRDIVLLKVLNAAIMAGAAAMVLWKAPFRLPVRAAIVFGYFFLYEYGTISRVYSLALLLSLAAFTTWPWQGRRWWVAAAAAVLLCQTSAYGAILGAAIAAAMVVQRLQQRPQRRLADGRIVLLGVLMVGSLALAAAQAVPPADRMDVPGGSTRTLFDAANRPSSTFEALFPLRWPRAAFWNGHPLTEIAWPWSHLLGSAVALAVLALLLWGLRRSRPAIALLAVAIAGCYAFGFVTFAGSIRHHGHQWIAVLGAWWIAQRQAPATFAPHAPGRADRWGRGVLLASLAVGLVASVHATLLEAWLPFSLSRQAAAMVDRHVPADALIVTQDDAACSSVAVRLDRPLLSLQSGDLGQWIAWTNRRKEATPERILDAARRYKGSSRAVWLLANAPVAPEAEAAGFSLVDKADEPHVALDEQYYLYRLKGTGGSASTPPPPR